MTLDERDLALRLDALADDAPSAVLPGRSVLARRRAATVRRRRSALAGAGLVAAVVVVAPLPALLRAAGPAPLAGSSEPVAPTFSFPDQAAVAEVFEVPADADAGRTARVVVRVRTERGRVGRVDLDWGDGRADRLDGAARCTPGAGPTTVELPAEHVYDAPGLYAVRAVPQVVTGCDDGVPRLSAQGGEAGQTGVEVR